MIYEKIEPAFDLRSCVRYFGVLENRRAGEKKTFKIIADGCPGLIFQEDPACWLDRNGQRLPQLFLHGLSTGHSHKTTKGGYRNIGVYFQPHAIRSVFGVDANTLTNGYAGLDSIVRNDLVDQLMDADSVGARIGILSDFIRGQIAINRHRVDTGIAAVIAKMRSDTDWELSRIRNEMNISERRLERIFKSHIGVSPKLYMRINRFQRALGMVRSESAGSLTGIAYHHDYADQSHFIREFREFAGDSPKNYVMRAYEQAVNFPEWRD